MNLATLREIVENRIANLGGNAFQDLCDRLCMKLFPDDYTPVRAAGPRGDRKNDGYCPKARMFFAAHATRGEKLQKTKDKIRSDLEGCLANHPDVATWVFLTNDTLAGDVEAYVDELRTVHPDLTIETWGHKRICEKTCRTFPQSVIEEIVDVAIGPTIEINSEIDYAKNLIEKLQASEARAVLERLWSQYQDKMTPWQRFRVQANLGHSYQAQGNWEEAARYFLKAKQYEPTHEKARALEALAYLWLGNSAKAGELSSALLVDFPEQTLAAAVYVRSVPKEVGFDVIAGAIRAHLLSDPEVALAMAEAAMIRGLADIAESYAANAHDHIPGNVVAREALADALAMRAHLEERFAHGRKATREETDCLEKACSLYTAAIDEHAVQKSSWQVARLRLKRSRVFLALGKEDEWEKDCRSAYDFDPSNEEAVFSYATIKAKHGELDNAIRLIDSLLGKHVRPVVELMLAQLLSERGNPNDKHRIRELLNSRLNDLPKESPEFCVEYLSWLSDVEREVNGLNAALVLLDNAAKGLIYHESALLLKAEVLRVAGNVEEAIGVARELEPLVSESTRSDTTRRTATLLYALGLHRDALRLWKRIVSFDYIGADTFRAIECAQRCGDVQYVLDLSSGLRSNGIWDRRIFELELACREHYNDTGAVVKILQDFLGHPPDAAYLPQARLRLSIAGIRTERSELIETDPRKLPGVADVPPIIGQHVVEVLRRGPNPILAAVYAYEMVRLNWDDPDAHAAMARVFFPEGPVPTIDEPTHVVSGSTICYTEDDTGREHWHTIEDSLIGTPQSTLHEYGLDNPLSQAMLGKKVGEKFYLVKDDIQERTATIKEVMSKYKYRFNDSLRELSTRFSHTGFVRQIVVPKNEGRFDLSVLKRMAERRAQSVNKMVDVYRDEPCPIYLLAAVASRSVIETMEYLIGRTNLSLRCCLGLDEEQEEAARSLSAAKTVVLDSTALATLLFTESYTALQMLPIEFVVTEGTLNDLRSTGYMHGDPHTQAGSFSTNGFVPASPENILRARAALQGLIDFVEKKCHVGSGAVVASLEAEHREQLLRGFGHAGLESMLLASQSDGVLWTDDLATAMFAKGQFGCRRVWSQFVFEHSANSGTLSRDVSDDVAVQLFGMRYYYARPSVSIIMHAIKECDGDVDRTPLCQVLDWFSDERANKDGQLMIAGGILKPLWQWSLLEDIAQRVTVRIMERLAQRPGGLDVIKGLLHNLDAIFWLDVINARKARKVIEAWLRGSRTRIIIP